MQQFKEGGLSFAQRSKEQWGGHGNRRLRQLVTGICIRKQRGLNVHAQTAFSYFDSPGPQTIDGVPLAAATLGVGLPTSINSCNSTQAYPEICPLSYSRP